MIWMNGIQTASAADLFVGVMCHSSEEAWVSFTDVDQNESEWIQCTGVLISP
jgi:hypothetical protein